jgi:hypothetical protein
VGAKAIPSKADSKRFPPPAGTVRVTRAMRSGALGKQWCPAVPD